MDLVSRRKALYNMCSRVSAVKTNSFALQQVDVEKVLCRDRFAIQTSIPKPS
jgi:hypothetical protein